MYQSRKIIRADGPASAAYTGKSIGIAVLDTGIYPHEDFILPLTGLPPSGTSSTGSRPLMTITGMEPMSAALLPAMAAVPRDDTGESLRNPTL